MKNIGVFTKTPEKNLRSQNKHGFTLLIRDDIFIII